MVSVQDRPLLILLPGTDGTGLFYDGLLSRLRDLDTRVLSYPQTGEQSYNRLGRALLPNLPQDRPYILIAESFAGPLAIWLAANAPHKPAGLVLAATFAASPFGWPGRIGAFFVSIMQRLTLNAWVINFLLFNGKDLKQSDQIRTAIHNIDRSVIADRIRSALTCDMRGCFGQITSPVLVLKAKHDRLLLPWLPDYLKALADAEHVILDLPHMVFQADRDGDAANQVRAFADHLFGKAGAS